MKFKNISVRDESRSDLQLRDLSPGLNVIYGGNGSGKTTIRRFLRNMLIGFETCETAHSSSAVNPAGYIDISARDGDLKIIRDCRDFNAMPRIESIGNSIDSYSDVPSSISQLNGNIDQKTFDEILNIGFRENTDSRTLSSILTTRFGVPSGKIDPIQIDHAAIREREALIVRTRELLTELNRRQEILSRQLSQREQLSRTEIDGLTRQLNDLSDRIHSIEETIGSRQRRTQGLDLEIDELRLSIERLRNQSRTFNVRRKKDDLPELLSKLDSAEKQILRWRKVHHDVQTQRNKLLDEMLNWVEEDVADKQLLPYEEIRQLLNSLETRVSEMDGYVGRMRDSNPRIDDGHHTFTGNLQSTLSSMRDEVYQLCRELNTQHLVDRRKTTVNELKQLRRCYVEVTDHVKRLVARRETIIREIARIDPARADLIVKSHYETCECSHHDQYLAERQVTEAPVYEERRIAVDVSAELARLHQLEDDRRKMQTDIDQYGADATDLIRRRDDLIRRRDALKVDNADAARRELAEVQQRIIRENDRLQSLLRQIKLDREIPEQQMNPLLENASRYLQRMTRNDLERIWVADNSDDLIVQNRAGAPIPLDQLSRSGKDQVRLAICLAASRALSDEGINLPIVLDDAFVNIDDVSTHDTAEVLLDYCRTNRQILLFTCHRSVADAMAKPGVEVLKLPERHIAATATEEFHSITADYVRPRRIDSTLNLYNENSLYDYLEPSLTATTAKPAVPNPVVFGEATHLADTRLMGNDNIGSLRRLGVRTIGDLLNFDPTSKAEELAADGIDLDQVDAWQSQSLLMIAIPQLRATDAIMLYSCGITDLDKLNSISADELYNRIRQFSNSTRGRRMTSSGYQFDRNRLGSWADSARANSDRFRNRRRWNMVPDRNARSHRDHDRGDREHRTRQRSPRKTQSYDGAPRAYQPREERTSIAPAPTTASSAEKPGKEQEPKLKFYLSRSSNVESAPTIGPRAAEKLEAAGISTVQDLLDTPAEQIAKMVNSKRIKADDVLNWQQQATLVCRIPQLRGHDAQFLVACGFTTVEQLSEMDPEKLYSVIGPFAKTRDGQKICRSGKLPDLAEVTDWINWSKRNRLLSAA